VKLVLFDIDGTLVDCGGQSRRPFAEALLEVFGETGDLDGYDFSGKTDTGIVYDLMTGAGLARERVLAGTEAVREAYLPRLERTLEVERMRLLPGVTRLLAGLAARADVTLGLLTGNWERGARIKLSRHDLNRFFAFGSFGDGRLGRDELPPAAWKVARAATGRAFTAATTLIVGDSLLDVACARAHGIPCLAVATGWTRSAALVDAGADWVLDDLAGAGSHAAFRPPGTDRER
jgi:phosphoglycolate phosphatase-like HAD superfamily hydrolase